MVEIGESVWYNQTNTKELDDPLLFRFHDWNGKVICSFNFNMGFTGWRTIWMKYEDMRTPEGQLVGDIKMADRNLAVARMSISVPSSAKEGNFYFDRLSFLTSRMQDQIAPDMQIPENNMMRRNRLWQWGRLWEWEQYPEPEFKSLTSEQTQMLKGMEKRMDEWAAACAEKYQTKIVPLYFDVTDAAAVTPANKAASFFLHTGISP